MRTVRAEEARSGEAALPAAALGAYSHEEARRQALAAGFDQYLVKPIAPEALLALVQTLAPRASPGGAGPVTGAGR